MLYNFRFLYYCCCLLCKQCVLIASYNSFEYANKRLILNLKINRSILHSEALKTDFSHFGTKNTKIVQLEGDLWIEILKVSK